MARSRRQVFRTAAAGITAAALAAISLSAAGPAQAAVTATVTVTTPTAVGPSQTFDVVVDVICPTGTAGTGPITADVQLGAGAAYGQVTDPNFETPALGTNPFHWAQTYTFTAPDLATLGGNSVDVTTTVSGRPCVNDATGVVKTNTVLVADLPSAPTITSATPGNGQATVAYTPVADPTGAPVTSYEYSVNGAAAVSAGLSNPFTAHGLINEVSNTITVRAVNMAGAGPWSAAANVTSVGPPASPTALAVTPGDKILSITFSAPPTPINAIDGYQYSTDGGTTWRNLPSLSTAYDITALSTNGTTALTNGTAYNVQVRAHNSLGYGLGTASVSGTPSTLPDAPNGVSVTSSNGAVDISFAAPANGGSAITDYLYSTDSGVTFVSAGSAALPVHITTTSDTAAPLSNGTEYGISIKSVNANGVSAPSIPVAATPGVAPDKPTITTFGGDTAVLISATFNTDGGIPVTLAQCQIDGGAIVDGTGITADGVSASFVITGLTNGQTYSFVCRVGNTAGYSAWSDAASGTPAAAPNAPTLDSVVPGVNSLTVNFTPGFDGGSTVTGYSVYLDGVIYTEPVTNATAFASSPIVLTGLLNNDPHTITVTATNAVGESLPSNSIYSIVGQTLVTVTASSPSQITYGTSIPAITWSTTATSTTSADWTTVPTCAVYASGDSSYATPLTGVQNAGTYVTHCTGGTSVQYYPSSYTNGSLTIAPASATNVITCTAPVTYNNTPQTPCTSTITGAGLTNVHGTVTYSNNTNAGTATASSTWSDANHTTATATNVNFTINKAASTNTITCPASVTYTGSLLTPCSSAITGVGLSGTAGTVDYANNTNVGTATANSTWAGDTNHNGSSASQVTFGITKAASTNVITCPASVTYTGSAQTPCTDTITGAGLSSTSATVTYASNTNVGTATANSVWAGDANHTGSTATQVTFGIGVAASTTVITCTSPVTYTGSALTPCHATVTGAGGLNTTATVNYTTNVDAGTGHATASYAGDSNHSASTATAATFTISPAASTTVVTCPASVTYDGSAKQPCTAIVTGANGLNTTASVNYTSNTGAGTAHASASFAGDANHDPSTGSQSFTIDKAASTTVVTCTTVTYDGTAQTPCTAAVTGVGGLSTTATVSYTTNTNAGTGHASASFAGDSNHTASSDAKTFTIDKAASSTTINCPVSVTYTGAARTPCTTAVTGAGTVTATATVVYASNTHAGTATANATTAGDSNHLGSTATEVTFDITKAASTTVVSCSGPVIATGTALTPCTATTTGAGGLNITTPIDYTDNITAGTATATATFAGDADHDGSTASTTFTVIAPSAVVRPKIAWSSTNKAAARSYVKVLGTLGSPAATISTKSRSSCLIKDATVYFLTAGTCQVSITQGGTTWKVLTAAVSKNNALAAPAKAQPLKTVGFAVTSTALTAANKAQLDALLPSLRKSKMVIVYGFASGRGAIVVSRSRARAAAVTAYLTARGVTVASSAGYGSSIAPLGKSPKDRVDIAIG